MSRLVKNFRSIKQFYKTIKNNLDNTPYGHTFFTLVPFYIPAPSLQLGYANGIMPHTTQKLFTEQNLNKLQLFANDITLPSNFGITGGQLTIETQASKWNGLQNGGINISNNTTIKINFLDTEDSILQKFIFEWIRRVSNTDYPDKRVVIRMAISKT